MGLHVEPFTIYAVRPINKFLSSVVKQSHYNKDAAKKVKRNRIHQCCVDVTIWHKLRGFLFEASSTKEEIRLGLGSLHNAIILAYLCLRDLRRSWLAAGWEVCTSASATLSLSQ